MSRQRRRIGVAACLVFVAVQHATTTLARQEPGKSSLEPVKPGDEAKVLNAGLLDVLGPATQPPDADGVAGLRPKTHAPVLTLRRAYELALIRHRAPSPPAPADRLPALVPKALDALARRHGVDDFARFQRDRLARRGDSFAFHDPAPDFLGLLVTLHEVESTRRYVMQLETLLLSNRELLGKGLGITQLQIDREQLDLFRQRDLLGAALRRHREAVDDFKVVLGLPPDAPLVVDRAALAPLTDVFDEIHLWSRRPDRELSELASIFNRLPDLPDLAIGGRSLKKLLEQDPTERDPGVLEDLLRAASRLDRPGDAAQALRIRRLVRRQVELFGRYDGDKLQAIMIVRIIDRLSDQITAPPPEAGGPALNAAPLVRDVVKANRDLIDVEHRIVESWAAYQAGHLALLRELGLVPGNDWAGYLERIIPPVAPRVLKPVAEKPAELPEPPPPPPPDK